jgi:hypothetical protein
MVSVKNLFSPTCIKNGIDSYTKTPTIDIVASTDINAQAAKKIVINNSPILRDGRFNKLELIMLSVIIFAGILLYLC